MVTRSNYSILPMYSNTSHSTRKTRESSHTSPFPCSSPNCRPHTPSMYLYSPLSPLTLAMAMTKGKNGTEGNTKRDPY